MVIPEREKGVKSIRIPRLFFRFIVAFFIFSILLFGILIYDYWKMLQEVYTHKHLTIENRELKEQIQLFQIKLNTITSDIDRIKIFERKLRVITGLNDQAKDHGLHKNDEETSSLEFSTESPPPKVLQNNIPTNNKNLFDVHFRSEDDALKDAISNSSHIEKMDEYKKQKKMYEQKMARSFGLNTGYNYTKEWFNLTRQSFSLAEHFARFDYRFNFIQSYVKELEAKINQLDQYLLDKESFMKSTPTLLPAKGWITSYYGLRNSPYLGKIRMHEGLDIGANIGASIFSPADGIVTFTGNKVGFGTLVKIDHGYGVETLYAHTSMATVKMGEKVKRGDLIAHVGNTGYSTGPHLHYEIRVNGTPVDPLYYILN